MKLTPYTKNCGMIVEDIQLAQLSDEEIVELRRAFAEHGVLFFYNQDLPPAEHLRFAKRFGTLVVNRFFQPVEDFPEIAQVRKEKGQTMNVGGAWHTDHSYDPEPAMGSILVARDLPARGGDTRFANMYKAWESLPEEMKARLEGLQAEHSSTHVYGKDGYYASTDLGPSLNLESEVGEAIHPVVIRHPDSGKKALYVNPGITARILGMSQRESQELLNTLYAHVDQADVYCDFKWQPGAVAMWDNRSTWHNAKNDYQGEFRLLHRITLAGAPLEAA